MTEEINGDAEIIGFAKFGRREHIEELFNKGHLYMNSLAYFVSIEREDLLRGDRFEGADLLIPTNNATLSCISADGPMLLGTIEGPTVYRRCSVPKCCVFCMFARFNSKVNEMIDPRNFGFGDSYLYCWNPYEFLKRVDVAFHRQNLKGKRGGVQYFDEDKYQGPIGQFKKSSRFSFQNEYRIAVDREADGPFILEIGDLSDICKIGQSRDIDLDLSNS